MSVVAIISLFAAQRLLFSQMLRLFIVSLVAFVVAPKVQSITAMPMNDLRPHCADFRQHCSWNSSTSSCTFIESVSFVCGPREAMDLPVPMPATGSLENEAVMSKSSFPGDSDGQDVKLPAVPGFTCHWDVAGDLHFAPGVTVALEGDDCLLHIGSGQMVLLGTQATLMASSLSIVASFVHLEVQAKISASYSGAFRDGQGLFTGTDIFGASHGGGGGQRLIANDTMLTEQTTRGFFDVRGRTVDVELVEDKEALLKQSSAGWQLAELWAKERALMTDPEKLTSSSEESEDMSAIIAPFLLGSGSRAVITGDNSSIHNVTVDGGGRIQIKASKDVVVMESAAIQANGASAIDGVSGGSGGSIVIFANALSVSGRVQAKGGDAFCTDKAIERGITHCYPAGGGGRVQITYMSSQLDTNAVDTTGGTLNTNLVKELLANKNRFRHVQVSALAGAAGTYYQVVQHSDGVHEAQLFISNDMQRLWPTRVYRDDDGPLEIQDMDTVVGGAVTSLDVGHSEAEHIDAVTITDGAVVATGCLKLAEGDLRVLNGSLLLDSLLVGLPHQLPDSISINSDDKPPLLQIRARDMIVSSEAKLMMPTSALQISARTVSMDTTATLEFTWSTQIVTSQNIHLDANISSISDPIVAAPTSQPSLSFSSDFSITINGHVEAINYPSIKSIFRTCKEQEELNLYYTNVAAEKSGSNSGNETTIPSIPTALPSKSNYTIIFNARKSIYLGEAEEKRQQLGNQLQQDDGMALPPLGYVSGGAVLMCAIDSIEISSGSIVSADGTGELANQGPGMGMCVNSIGGGAGYGGRGADSSVVTSFGNYASGGLPYGTRSGLGMLGSGGGCVDGGNGGGLVMLGASGLVLNGEIRCNGDGGANGAGGGSGGFLGLSVAQYLRGHGHISAVGGGSECTDSSASLFSKPIWKEPKILSGEAQYDAADEQTEAQLPSLKTVPRLCGGGGGGGRLQLTGCELSTFDRCTREFDGNYTVAGGATSYRLSSDDASELPLPTPASADSDTSIVPAGASGSFFGFPCPPGSGGLFCRLCSVGKYKSESNSAECVVCTNAPANAHYVGKGSTSARCDWACDPGYSGYYCVSPIQQLLDACGYACRNRKEPSYTRMYNSRGAKGERQHLLSSAVANSQRSLFASLFRCFYWPRVVYPKLMERDLPEHMARLYLAGYNDPDSPLKLRTTVPPNLKKVLYDVEFKNLADRINRVLAWQRGPCSSWGKIVYFLVAALLYPFASEVKLFRRHIRVNELKRIVARYNHACMKGPRARGLLNAVKLGYCADYSLVYLELLYKESSQSVCVPTTKIGKPSLPLVLLFAGCGTYFSPFYLDPNDLLVRSIPQCPELTAFIDEPWIEFVAELNELLRVVQREKGSLVQSLTPVAVYLEKQRVRSSLGSNMGKLGGLRIYLGRFYVQDEFNMGEEFKLGLFLTTANDSLDNVSSQNNFQQSHSQFQPSSSRYSYGSNHSKELNNFNVNDVYGYGRGDSLEYPGPRRDDGTIENGAMLNDMGGWGSALSNPSSSSRGKGRSANESANEASPNPVSSIREEALRIRSSSSHGDALVGNSTSGRGENSDDVLMLTGSGTTKGKQPSKAVHRTFYEGWLGPVDASLPIPGVLICADELQERLADRTPRQIFISFLRMHLLPRNVPRSSSLNLSWMLSISLLTLLMVDLAITFAILVNLKCVTEGEVDHDCSASIMVPVLLVPPLALVLSPIVGIISLALFSSTFTRRFSVWNALSMISVGIAILACITQSSRLVAPWFAGPLPLLPVIGMGVKAGQAYLVERYIAFQETQRRRRGWRGIMKRRLSDASIPTESP
ncbi:putative nucleoside diphosphate kinase 7 [Plasmopara halstedii]